jgi:hypothetical protein
LIRPEQLVEALERLDPHDRELLALSLRRRVPDEALGRVYDCAPGDVARRRAAAIERLADDLGAQRGEDLGAVLKALLEPETWASVDSGRDGPAVAPAPAVGSEFDERSRRPAAVPGQRKAANGDSPDEEGTPPEHEPRVYRIGGGVVEAAPDAVESAVSTPEAVPDPAAPAPVAKLAEGRIEPAPKEREPEERAGPAPKVEARTEPAPKATQATRIEKRSERTPVPPREPSAPAKSQTTAVASPRERPQPVLEMLGGDRPAGRGVAPQQRSPRTMILAGLAIAAFAALAGVVGARQLGDGGGGSQSGGGGEVRHFTPQERGPLGAAPFPSDPQSGSCYPTAYVRHKTVLYRDPGGAKLITVAARTEWSSPRVLGVASQREGWLAVTVPELPNGEVGWMQRSQARVDCVRWSLHADLSRRLLYVRKDGHTVHKLSVAIGSREHPTPQGRFAVTDRLRVEDKSSPYGCCVLALSGHQTKLPDDWPGGDRLAVHATTDTGSIGSPVSLGCMRATSDQVRWLVATIPLGSPIFIRR